MLIVRRSSEFESRIHLYHCTIPTPNLGNQATKVFQFQLSIPCWSMVGLLHPGEEGMGFMVKNEKNGFITRLPDLPSDTAYTTRGLPEIWWFTC